MTELDKKVIYDISPYEPWCTAELRISSSVKTKKLIFWYDHIILNPNDLMTIKMAFVFPWDSDSFFLFWPTSANYKLWAMRRPTTVGIWSLASIAVDLETCSDCWFFISNFGYYFWRKESLTTKDFRWINVGKKWETD